MTGYEYITTVCPTTVKGRDPNREDVADAFEDGIAEGYKAAAKELLATIHKEVERRLEQIVTGMDYTAEIELKGLLDFLDELSNQ